MRPNATESLRAVQAALAEVIAPELTSAFALDASQTVQMLVESLAAECDTAAETLNGDNETLRSLLSGALEALQTLPGRNERVAPIVTEIEKHLREDRPTSLVLSDLSSRNGSLRATLETVVVAFEEITGSPESQEIDAVRTRIYEHLKDVAARGWSFWDVSSFREKMAAVRMAVVGGDAHKVVE
jgi:hypothetical protein